MEVECLELTANILSLISGDLSSAAQALLEVGLERLLKPGTARTTIFGLHSTPVSR